MYNLSRGRGVWYGPSHPMFNRIVNDQIVFREMIPVFIPRDWDEVSMYFKLSEDFIREFKDHLNWKLIIRHQKLSEKFIVEMADYIDWPTCELHQDLSNKTIEKCYYISDKETNRLERRIYLR